MNIPGVIVLLIVAAIIYMHTAEETMEGGDITPLSPDISTPYYTQQFRELHDTNHVLSRPVGTADKHIDSIRPYNKNKDTKYYIQRPVRTYLDLEAGDRQAKKTPEDLKVIIQHRQPYFLGDALVLDRYGKKYYHDARYPKQPISVMFAIDEKGFVARHPNEYPSYVINKTP